MRVTSRDEPTVAKSRPEFKNENKLQPASWLFVEFFAPQWSVRPPSEGFLVHLLFYFSRFQIRPGGAAYSFRVR